MNWNFYDKNNNEGIKQIRDFLNVNDNIVDGIPLHSLSGGIEGLLNSANNFGNILVYRKNVDDDTLGICIFTYGDPNENYEDKQILYILLAAILPKVRGRSFKKLIKAILEECDNKEIRIVRFKSPFQNEKNNRLYDKIAQRKQVTVNLTGHRSILYEVNLRSWKVRLTRFISRY